VPGDRAVALNRSAEQRLTRSVMSTCASRAPSAGRRPDRPHLPRGGLRARHAAQGHRDIIIRQAAQRPDRRAPPQRSRQDALQNLATGDYGTAPDRTRRKPPGATHRALVDTAALRHNLRGARATAPASGVLMAVIKRERLRPRTGPGWRGALALADWLRGRASRRGTRACVPAGLAIPSCCSEGVFSPSSLPRPPSGASTSWCTASSSSRWLEGVPGARSVSPGSSSTPHEPASVSASRRLLLPTARLRRMANVARPHARHARSRCGQPADPGTAAAARRLRCRDGGAAGERSVANSAGLIAWPDTRPDGSDPDSRSTGVSLTRRHGRPASACGPR